MLVKGQEKNRWVALMRVTRFNGLLYYIQVTRSHDKNFFEASKGLWKTAMFIWDTGKLR